MKKISLMVLLVLLVTGLNLAIFPDTSTARVFRVFGFETFARSTGKPVTEVRHFPVQYPGDADFTLHAFYFGVIEDLQGIVPSAVITLNGQQVIGPDEFNRTVQYIKKPIALTEGNSLSVELRGKSGPDGSNLLGPDLSYLWTILQKPENAQAALDVASSNPELSVEPSN